MKCNKMPPTASYGYRSKLSKLMAKEARRHAAYSRLVGDNGFSQRERERERERNTKPLDYCRKKMSDSLQHRV
jgi:hypothetical protein